MKKVSISVLLIFSVLFAATQQSWKIRLNNVVILAASEENEMRNTRKIDTGSLKKKTVLEIIYSGPKDKSMTRSLFIVDENERELFRKDNCSNIKIPLASFKKALANSNKLRIFTTAIPKDPELAARVRVRRVHLCTLELK